MNVKHMNSRNLFALTATLMLTAAAAQGQSAFTNALMNLSPGPVGYWPLQETVAPPAPYVETNLGSLGAIGNAYYASTNVVGQYQLGGVPFSGIPGDSGGVGVYFEGNPAAFMAVPTTSSSVSLQAGHAFTVEAWIYPNVINEFAGIVSQTGPVGGGGLNEANSAAGWSLNVNYMPRLSSITGIGQGGLGTTNTINSTNSLLGFSFHVFNGNGPNGGAEADAGNLFSSNTWYHLVGVFDGTNCTLYVDGTNDTSFHAPINGSFVPDTWDPIMFGVSHALDAGGIGPPFPPYAYKGGMADVAIYTNALSAAQVLNDYQSAQNGSYTNYIFSNNNPYMFWQMSAPQYAVPATNSYPTAANVGSDSDPNIAGLYQPGTLPGAAGPRYSGMGSADNACAFNGLNSGVMVWTNNNSISSPLNATNKSISLLCWFKGNPADTENRFQSLVSRGNNGWRLALDQTGHIHWNFGSPTPSTDLTSIWPYNDGNWHFVVGVYTNTGTVGPGGFGWTATNYLYVDGRLENSALVTNNETAGITNLGLIIGGDSSFLVTNLGAVSPGYYSGQRYFAGSLAHVAYFTDALSAAQVVNLYTNAVVSQAPYIIAQPVTGRTITGASANYQFIFFGVVANGSPNLSYQWYFNTTSNYSGATALSDSTDGGTKNLGSQTYQVAVSNLVNSDSGYYYVVVANSFGSVTSLLASLTVDASPVITAQSPSGAFSIFTNQTATLSVTANGESPLTYQWFTNGVADTTAGTASSYAAGAQQAASGETYYCQVSNANGSTNSATDTVSVLSLPANIVGKSYGSNVIALGATAYWPMHEKETQPLVGDVETNYGTLGAIGNGYFEDWATPTVTHNSPGAIAGDSDGAATFYYNVQDGLVIPHVAPQLTIGGGPNQFALEAWVKPFSDNIGGIGSYMVIMGQGGANGLNGGANHGGFDLQYGGTSSTFSMVVWNGVAGSDFEDKTAPNFPPGQWYHVVCYWTGTNYNLYINGNLQTLQAPNATDNPQIMAPDYWSPLTIGGGRWGGSGIAQQFAGEIDEVAVYTNVTTADAAQSLASIDYAAGTSSISNYFQTVTNNQPLLYYRMDSPSYTEPPYSAMTAVLTNYGSLALNGVYVPGAMPGSGYGPTSGGGVPGLGMTGTNAMAGNGVMSFADAGIAPQLDPVTTNAFSYAVWFRGYPGDFRSFPDVMAANDSTWRTSLHGNTGVITGHGYQDVNGPQIANDGNWHQLAITATPVFTNNVYCGTNMTVSYLDGTVTSIGFTTSTNTPTNNPGPEVLLGDEWGNTNCVTQSGGRSLAGEMCEAAFFYGTTLTSNQVQTLYNSADMAPTILTQPISGTGIISLGFTNSVTASGAQPLYYQWYTNGVAIGLTATNISGMNTNGVLSPITTEQLIVNPMEFADVGSYYVVVSNVFGVVTSSIVNLAALGAPVITNVVPTTYTNLFTIYAGVNPTFTVQAVGAPPLGYYWFTNGVADTGVANTSASLILANVQSGATIYCVVSNFLGTTPSTTWAYQVIPDPTTPYPAWVVTNNAADFWRLNDAVLDGADNGNGDDGYIANDYINGNNGFYTNIDLANGDGIQGYNPTVDPNDVGANFDYVNPNSDANSLLAPDFSTPSGNAEFTVSAWVYPTASEPGNSGMVTKGLFNQEEFNLDNGGTQSGFRFECRNAAGTDSSASSTVTTQNPSAVNHWYHIVGVCDEANGHVSIYVNGQLSGTAPITAGSGLFNSSGTPISFGSRSSVDPSYFFGDDNQQFAGYIADVAIFKFAMNSNQVVNAYSSSGNVPPFLIQTPAVTNAVSAGGYLTNSPALAAGTGPLTYWWNLVNNGNTVSNVFTGSTNANLVNASLIVSNTPASWNGDQLELVVSNAFGGTNFSVNLVVSSTPVIITNLPAQVTLVSGRYYTYAPTVIGSQPLNYQWYENNAAISGGTNSTYSFLAAGAAINTYYFTVSNIYGGAISSTSAVTVVSSYESMILSNGPVAYWPLNETPDNGAGNNGVVAHDISGYGNNMFYTNAVIGQQGLAGDPYTVAQFGTFATSYSMAEELSANGVPDMSQLAAANGGNGEFTVEAWAAPTAGQALNDRIVDEGHFFAEEWALDIGTTSPSTAFRFTVRDGSGGEHDARGTIVPDGNWHYIVGVCDEANANVLLYVDGVLNASNNFDGTIAAGSGIEEDNQPITIGNADVSQTGVGQYTSQLIGKISDVAVYTNVLSGSQILAHYQAVTAGVYPVPVVTNQLPLPNTNLFTLYKGVSPSFMAVASGISPLSYQWYTNNVAVGGATNTTFTMNNVQSSFSSYCIITNPAGSGTSMVWNASVVADPTSLFAATVLSNNPVAYWRLNESGGNTIANDYAGGANGVYGSATTTGLPGVPFGGVGNETAVAMNNHASSINGGCVASSGVIMNTNTATFLCWIYPYTSVETNPSGLMFFRSGSSVGGSQIGGGNDLDYTWGNNPSTYDYVSTLNVPANIWSLVALATTPTNATLYVFNANGVGSATNNVANGLQSLFGGIYIGADPLTTNRIFQGEISESALFNYTLTSAQLSQVYSAATNAAASGPSFTNAPPISFASGNGQLSLTWPSKYVGYYYLEVQTNKLTVGISTNWVPYGGSIGATLNSSSVLVNMSRTNGTTFYRLMTNAP